MNNITDNENLLLPINLSGYVINPTKIKLIDIAIYTNSIYNAIKKNHYDFDSHNSVLVYAEELSGIGNGQINYTIQVVEKSGNIVDETVATDYYLTKSEEGGGGSIYDTFQKKEDMVNYVTKNELEDKKYLTEHQPIDHLATKNELSGKADKTEVELKLDKTEAEKTYQPVGNYLTSHQNIDHKLDTKVYNADKVNYATKSELNTKANKEHTHDQYLTSHQDISGKLDKSIYENDKVNYATKSEIPSLNGYATEEWVSQQGYLTEIPAEYVTETELNDKHYLTAHQDISGKLDKSIYENDKVNYATKSEIPDVSNYVTNEALNQKNYLTEHQDISGKADKTELSNYQEKGDYVTNEALNGKGFITEIPAEYVTDTELNNKHFLTEHQKLKTVNNQSLIGEGNITIEGGSGASVIVDDHLDGESLNPVQNKIVTNELNQKIESVTLTQSEYDLLEVKDENTIYFISDANENLHSAVLTQTEYDQLQTKDKNTMYFISDYVAPEYATKDEMANYATTQYVDQLVGDVNVKINDIKNMI